MKQSRPLAGIATGGVLTIAAGVLAIEGGLWAQRNVHPVVLRTLPGPFPRRGGPADAKGFVGIGGAAIVLGLFLLGYCLYEAHTRRQLLGAVKKST